MIFVNLKDSKSPNLLFPPPPNFVMRSSKHKEALLRLMEFEAKVQEMGFTILRLMRNPEATDEIIAEVRSAYVDVYRKLKEAEKIVIEYKGETK